MICRNDPRSKVACSFAASPARSGFFRDISVDVYHATGEAQLPELSLSIISKFYFKEPAAVTANPLVPADPRAAAGDHWKSAESIGTLEALKGMTTVSRGDKVATIGVFDWA